MSIEMPRRSPRSLAAYRLLLKKPNFHHPTNRPAARTTTITTIAMAILAPSERPPLQGYASSHGWPDGTEYAPGSRMKERMVRYSEGRM